MFIWYKQCFLRLTKFQVAFSIYVLFAFAPCAGAGTSFSLLRQRKGSKRKATAGTGLASPNFPHCTRFFGRARNLRLRRFEHASPYSPKNRAPFGCASRGEIDPTVCIYSELNLNQYSVARLAVLSVLSAARRLVLI